MSLSIPPKNNMRILLIGASGQVGKPLMASLKGKHTVIGTAFSSASLNLTKLDIRDNDAVKKVFSDFSPDVAILLSALTDVDYCEDHQDEAYNINVTGTKNVAECAMSCGSRLIYFSTDYIFDGKNGPYKEDDIPNPISYYGFTKLEGEKMVQSVLDKKSWAIVRTAVVFSYGHRNFTTYLIDNLSRGEVVRAYTDQFNSPTYAPNLAEAVAEIAVKKLSGVYNVAGKDVIDRYSYALKVAKAFGLPANLIKPSTTAEFPQKAKRPPRAGLIVKKAESILQTALLTLNESIKQFKNA